MNQPILVSYLCYLCLLFYWSPVLGLSKQEKRDIVGQFVKTFSKKKVFYLWQSPESSKRFIEAGEWTPELYDHYRGISCNHFAGLGLCVSESVGDEFIPLASAGENTLIQVELEEDSEYLDLSDEETQKQLGEKKISIDTLEELNLQITIKYSHKGQERWALKRHTGMKFKPFSSHELSIEVLEDYYDSLSGERKAFFKAAIREDILTRAFKGESLYGSPFVDILEERLGYLTVESALNVLNNITEFKTLKEITRWLRNGEEYLFDYNKRTLARKGALDLPINSVEGAIDFLKVAKPYLYRSDIDQMIERISVNSQEEGDRFLAQTGLSSSYFYVHPEFVKREPQEDSCGGKFSIP